MADYFIINKEGTAKRENIDTVVANLKRINPTAKIIHANSPVSIADENAIRGKRVLVVEDGPTLTHGNMAYGAGLVAAKKYGAAEIVKPQPYLAQSLKKVFEEFPQLDEVLPAMGYTNEQLKELEETINRANCDVVLAGTPIDLNKIISTNKPIVRVTYELEEIGEPNLMGAIEDFERKAGLK